jgi:hypothetical protein
MSGAGSYASTTPSFQTCPSGGGGALTSFTTGNLSPLFTASLGSNPTTAPALAFTLANAAPNSVLAGPASGGAGAPTYQTAPTISAANMTSFPTLNQSTTGNAGTATALASVTGYSVYGSGASSGSWLTPTANGQCLMSGASSYATTTPSFQTCPSIGGTVTSITAGSGLSGGTITGSGTISLTNTATTVNSQTCTLGLTCTIPFQTNGTGNTSQAGINLLTSTANSVGLTLTPTNSATNAEKFEITGGSYTGNAGTATALAATPSQCGSNNFSTGVAASGNANCAPPSFSNLSSGTNSSAAMLVGAGASLAPISTGTISANQVNGLAVPTGQATVGTNSSGQLISGVPIGVNIAVTAYSPYVNVQQAIGPTFTSSSTTVTTASSDPPFAAGDVGKIIWGTTNCSITNGEVSCTTLALPQTTITAYNSAHSVTVASAPTANNQTASSGFTGWLFWGNDDTSAFTSAFSALLANGGGTLQLPCGPSFVQAPLFIVPTTTFHRYPISIIGCPGGASTLVPTPNFAFATYSTTLPFGANIFSDYTVDAANTGSGSENQWGYVWDKLKDFTVWGGGVPNTSGSSSPVALFLDETYVDNVAIIGWNWNAGTTANLPGSCAAVLYGAYLTATSVWSAGGCGMAVAGDNTYQFPNTIINSLAGIDENASLLIFPTYGSWATIVNTFGNEFSSLQPGNGGGSNSIVMSGGTWNAFGDVIANTAISGGVANWNSVTARWWNSSGASLTSTAVMNAHSVNFFTASPGVAANAGTKFYDLGGNISGSLCNPISTGLCFGTASVTGVAQTAAHIVLTSGWGTGASVGTVKGNTKVETFTITAAGTPGASPVVTVTFPVNFATVQVGCTITQTGGTFGVLSAPALVPAYNQVAITFVGTPVAAQTYTFVLNCDNP